MAARGEEPARGVHADVVEQVVERLDRAGALRHLHALAALGEAHELHQHDLERLGLPAQRLPGRLHARDVTMVVGAPDVDRVVIGPLDLVQVVGDVASEVGPVAVRAAQHAVLVGAVRRRPEPERAVVLVHIQPLERLLDLARLVQGALREELVHPHAEAVQGRAHALEHQLDPPARHLLRLALGGALDALGQLAHVVPLVAVLRRLLAPRPRLDRLAEALHLAPGVVHVVLALHAVAGPLQDACQRITVGRVARRGDRHRAGRVRAHELEVHVPALGAGAVVLARLEQGRERVEVPAVGHEQVEEAGPRDLHALDGLAEPVAEPLAQLLRDRARRLAHGRREQHRRVRGVIAEVRPRRAVELQARAAPVPRQVSGGLFDGAREVGDGIHAPTNSDTARGRGSCGPGRAARGAPPGRAGGAA